MKGRKPVPTVLRMLAGNPQHRPMVEEPIAPGELIDPPDWMVESQKALWRCAIDNAPKGLLRQLDRDLLAVWVVACDLHAQAAKHVKLNGMMVKSPNVGLEMQSPYVAVINRQSEIMMRAASELGFSPTSRSRIAYGGQTTSQKQNKFANNAARRQRSA